MVIRMKHALRVQLRMLLFVVGGLAYVRGVIVITNDWGWGSLAAVLTVFLPIVTVFLVPIYEGIVHGSWLASLLFYGLFIVLAVPAYWLNEDRTGSVPNRRASSVDESNGQVGSGTAGSLGTISRGTVLDE